MQPLFHLMTKYSILAFSSLPLPHPHPCLPTNGVSLDPQLPLPQGLETLRKSFLKSDCRISCHSLSPPLAPSPVTPPIWPALVAAL